MAVNTHVDEEDDKVVIYQVFTRLFGNKNQNNKPWGTIEENGVGKFSDFTEKALNEIHALGATHVWFTGIPHHASVTDYSDYGIPVDDPDVVKGRAGSPYAVRDYYNVDPDLATDPTNRLTEFEALIDRTHNANLKVIIDIVPNHVARRYHSLTKPETSFGLRDNIHVAYAKNNDFYYVPGHAFAVPDFNDATRPLGGEAHPLADGFFDENPARWTGNGARSPKPDVNDWYETVKINYGVKPNGENEFPALPDELLRHASTEAHYQFWRDKDVPASWVKFKDIALYWLDKGVDGFRYDMAEMVPVAFWSYLNSQIKHVNNEALLLAEVYQPALYRDYIQLGRMDYLYDKVDFYDSIKAVMQGTGDTASLVSIQNQYADIQAHLLHFLENHDEQRIASPEFAGDANSGKPALVVSALISEAPMLIYFGQEVGEDGSEQLGFGQPSRTSIFDYGGVPAHQRWMNNGRFDGGQLDVEEKQLRDYYKKVLNIAHSTKAVTGDYMSLMEYADTRIAADKSKILAFARWSKQDKLVSVSNFYTDKSVEIVLTLPSALVDAWQPDTSTYFIDALTGMNIRPQNKDGEWVVEIKLDPLQSVILQ